MNRKELKVLHSQKCQVKYTGQITGRYIVSFSLTAGDQTMKTYTAGELAGMTFDIYNDDVQYDNEGQLVIYTGVYKWDDESYRDEAELKDEDNEDEDDE